MGPSVPPRWFPRTTVCSTPNCGFLNHDLTLKDREWTCPSCGITHDRGQHAAINVKRLASYTVGAVAMRSATDAPGFGDLALQVRSETRWLPASGVGPHHCAPVL
jgi:transposase